MRWILLCLMAVAVVASVHVHPKPTAPLHSNKTAPARHKSNTTSDPLQYVTKFTALAEKARNTTRTSIVTKVLSEAAGVYVDKDKGRRLGLGRTVFMSMAAFDGPGIAHYKVYLRNFLCFVRHYRIDLVLSMLHRDQSQLEVEAAQMAQLGVRVLPFPEELLWRTLATKRSSLKRGKAHVDYSGDVPSFQAHGALVMLIPVLEALQLGYDVVYLDVDIGLVQDPLPFLTAGGADFVSSLEVRHCAEFFSVGRANTTNWQAAEPNTGVMHVRATQPGIQLFRGWLERIVDFNFANDQRAFDRKALGAQYTSSCLSGSQADSEMVAPPTNRSVPTFCFLSEALFQNGMVAVMCPPRQATRDDWVLQMHRLATPGLNALTNESLGARYPVAVHVNYCNGKSHELEVRGLWLLDSHLENGTAGGLSCRAFDPARTYYANARNWTAEVADIRQRRAALLLEVQRNGSVVQGASGKDVYLVDERTRRRRVPDKATFESFFGDDWGRVRVVPTELLEKIELGEALVSAAANQTKTHR